MKFTILLLLKTLYETTSEEDDDGGDDERENKSGLLDLEDLGPMMNTMKQAKEEREASQLKGPKRSVGMLQCVFVSYWLRLEYCRCISKTLCWFSNIILSHLHNDVTE